MRLSHRQDVLLTFHRLEKKSQKRFRRRRRHVLASNPCRAMGVVVVVVVEVFVSQLLVITW